MSTLAHDRTRLGECQRPEARADASATADHAALAQMLGRSPPMLELYRQIRRVAPTEATVLLTGETGTGKELAARAIHELSPRRRGPFVAINCGAIQATLIESELFGHEQGSFTGANRRHHGVLARADHGTLFLDEITEMAPGLQVTLLRVLETGQFHRVGGETSIRTDTRFVAAANRAPEQAVRDGRLREDLFYRLRVFPLMLPPLRERGDDIELLANHFLTAMNRGADPARCFTDAAVARMRTHPWPGNVRELKHRVQQMHILADREIDAESLAAPTPARRDRIEVPIGSSIAAAERLLITATLAQLNGNKGQAAKVLGISLKTLYCRLSLYEASPRTPD